MEKIYEKPGSGRVLGECHGVAESSEALGVTPHEAVRVEAIALAAAQLAVRLAAAQQVICDDENAVGHGDDGLLSPRRLTSRRDWAAR